MDAVASYYDRNILMKYREVWDDVFALIIGGGIRKIKDIHTALRVYADKIAITSQLLKIQILIVASKHLIQSTVSSIDAKMIIIGKFTLIMEGTNRLGVLD